MESLGTRIKRLREERGLSQSALARAAGVSQPVIAELEAEKQSSSKKLPEIARALGVDMPQLDERFVGVVKNPPAFFSEDRNMPVYAAAEGGGGHIIVTTDTVEYVRRPYTLETVTEAYGILIVGESMVPAFEPGDTAWVNPRLPPMRDVDVILYAEDGNGDHKATIKRLTGWTEKEWHLRQYNPAKDFRLPRTAWPKLHRVVGKFSRR